MATHHSYLVQANSAVSLSFPLGIILRSESICMAEKSPSPVDVEKNRYIHF